MGSVRDYVGFYGEYKGSFRALWGYIGFRVWGSLSEMESNGKAHGT